jgi:hypothetical protein
MCAHMYRPSVPVDAYSYIFFWPFASQKPSQAPAAPRLPANQLSRASGFSSSLSLILNSCCFTTYSDSYIRCLICFQSSLEFGSHSSAFTNPSIYTPYVSTLYIIYINLHQLVSTSANLRVNKNNASTCDVAKLTRVTPTVAVCTVTSSGRFLRRYARLGY